MAGRAVAGLVAAAFVALAARRAGALSTSGAVAATVVGAASVAAGWSWGALLVTYFVASVLLSRLGASRKEARTGSVVAKGGRRDAAQVLANGGVYALLALLSPGRAASAAALGALAAATADTWATELGTLAGGTPRSLRTLRRVPAGTSGGVSLAGTAALAAGAAFIALLGRLFGVGDAVLAVAVAGMAGALADSVLGATVQERRWCPRCERATERRVHDCGAPTARSGGLAWLDNDAVNAAATIVGAAVAAAIVMTNVPRTGAG